MHRFLRWKNALMDAHTVSEVGRVMGEYLQTLRPEDVDELPELCRRALTADDISDSALVLIREELTFTGRPEIADMLHEVAHTYVAAANRIVQIRGRGEPVTQP